MCRIFGFRSVIHSQVHRSLLDAENALGVQSLEHPDGWGVAFYKGGCPNIIKAETKAMEDNLFKKVSGVVSSETVVAHIRRATFGELNVLNTHPFQYGHWIFVHNGNIRNFDKLKSKILDKISPNFKRFILGETDSEHIFYFIMTKLAELTDPESKTCDLDLLAQAVKTSMTEIMEIIGPCIHENDGTREDNALTILMTNGTVMLGHHGGKDLHFSTHKNKCPERDTCPSFAPECEAPAPNKSKINHLIFSSEPLSGENVWNKMSMYSMVGADQNMNIVIYE